jgi:hypothetical protein
MRINLVLTRILIAFSAARSVSQPNRPPEIPSHYQATSGRDF